MRADFLSGNSSCCIILSNVGSYRLALLNNKRVCQNVKTAKGVMQGFVQFPAKFSA